MHKVHISATAVLEKEPREAVEDNVARAEHKATPEMEPEQLPADDGVDVDDEPELESELATLLGGTAALGREVLKAAEMRKQVHVAEATSPHAQEDAPEPEEPVDATSDAVAHEPLVEEAAVAASESTETGDQPVEHRVADIDPIPDEPAQSMSVANDRSDLTPPESSTTVGHSKPEHAHEGVVQTTQGKHVAVFST